MPELRSIRRCQPLLGTFVEVSLTGSRTQSELLAIGSAAFAEVRRIDALMSFHRADSELTRINQMAAGNPLTVSGDMQKVLAEALWLSQISEGLFDISVGAALVACGKLPDHGARASSDASWRDIELLGRQLRFRKPLIIDLGGIAKGYAVDCAMAAVPADLDVCINAGGDLRMRPWHGRTASIRHPGADSGALLPLSMRDAALATSVSGFADQLGLIIDPRLSEPAHRICSYSVFASSAMRADGLTKIACLAPERAHILQTAGAQAIAIDARGQLTEFEPAPVSQQWVCA